MRLRCCRDLARVEAMLERERERERERESIVLHVSDLTNVKTSDIESALSLVMLQFEHAEVVDTTACCSSIQ